MVTFEVKRPTSLELCEAYSSTQPGKILGLRSDSIALILQMANVNSESRVLLVDKTKGLLTGALIERGVSEIMCIEFAP